MKRITCSWIPLLLVLLVLLAGPGANCAENTHAASQGRFAIDLPKGWELAPQTDDNVFVFQGDKKSIIIEYVPGVNDLAALMTRAQTSLRASGLTEAAPEGDLREMKVNGLPARWGTYKSGKVIGSFTGAVARGDDGLYFLCIMTSKDMKSWQKKIEKAFQSIRTPGETVTGVKDEKKVSAPESAVGSGSAKSAQEQAKTGTASVSAGSPTPWKSDLVSLTLPPGWKESPKPPGIEKEVKGWFKNDNLPGATLMAICYRGRFMNLGLALDGGVKTVKAAIPNAEATEFLELEIGKEKAYLAVYKGTAAAGTSEVELSAVIAVVKADKCYVDLVGIVMSSLQSDLRSQVLEAARTVK